MNERLVLALFLLLSGLNLASASESEPDRFWIGFLRSDWVLAPFALYDRGQWSTPWPEYLYIGESGPTRDADQIGLPAFDVSSDYRLTPRSASLADLPAAWMGETAQMPTRWYVWSRPAGQQPIEVTEATQYEAKCVYNWGLQAEEPDAETLELKRWPREPGFAASTRLAASPMIKVDAASEESREALSLIETRFRKLERGHVSRSQNRVGDRLRYYGQPVSEEERDKSKLLVKQIVKNAIPIDGRTIYYVEMRRHYRKPEDFYDPTCDAITLFTAWLLKENGRISILNAEASLTNCEMKGEDIVAPDHLISVGGNDYVVSVNQGWESESYTVDQITDAGLRQLVSRSGGGC